MSDDVDIQQEILQRTLQEVGGQQERDEVANPCVICLEPVSECAVAVPCQHANFDFLCLVSWLEQRRSCPLCKSDVESVRYDLNNRESPKVYRLPPLPPQAAAGTTSGASSFTTAPHPRASAFGGSRRQRRPPSPRLQAPDDPLLRRQNVYRHQLYSLRVGSNRVSQYREFTPDMFNRDEGLVSRARKWIRRELRVFAFLNPETETETPNRGRMTRPGHQRLENRRGKNAEFLLEYVIAILRTVDIKGSAGQAEELLRDFLGRDNARLFLHELQAWLRSPFTSLEDWDRNVQYDETPRAGASTTARRDSMASDRTSTPVHRGRGRGRGRGHDRGFRGRVSKPHYPRGWQSEGRPQDALAQARRIQHARDRYIPD
ncbi:RING finger domain protein [Aspergillus steynii IBT 23096]|uniref:RING-type E3 ubiquitin transferase n=1 Tax=Aspergillus steynii IBT 23096 TaxID=1392250 RepID=A0A2I2GIR2_9EURO|nr:RING finger domain protein [Aspergillus steynii IBT 23096]PLB52772.1 RING finger domain protein [Aspergillus steynii IBT 23096]